MNMLYIVLDTITKCSPEIINKIDTQSHQGFSKYIKSKALE